MAATFFVSLGLLALLALGRVEPPGQGAEASHAGGMDAIRFDLDADSTPANTATSFGTIEDCQRINENDAVDADETTADTLTTDTIADNIPVSNRLLAFSYTIGYSEANMTVQSVNIGFLLGVNAGSALFNTSDAAPDTDGSNTWVGAGLDTGNGVGEAGSGVLARQTISSDTGAAAAVYPLYLGQAVHIDEAANAQLPDNIVDDTDGDTTVDGILDIARIAIDTGCPLPLADVELISLSLTSLAPPTVPAGTPFQLETSATATNQGPNPADIEIETSVPGVPSDCLVNPPGPQSTQYPAVPALDSRVATHNWTVTCTDPSSHNFSGSGSVVITGLAQESNPGNNGPLNDPEVQVITGEADPKITAVNTTAPGTAATGAPFNVTVQATLHNNGPVTPANVDTTLDLAVPVGCNRVPNNNQVIDNTSLPISTPTNVQAIWTVTCVTAGLKTFDGTADTALDQLHVTDPTPGNNSGTDQAQTDTSLGQADVKVTTVTSVAPPNAPINTNFPVTVDTTVHNNGPFAPVNADITLTLNLPPDCFTPVTTLVFEDASLGPSIAAQLPQITFFVGCISHSFHNITATATIVVDDPLAGDPTPGNNSSTSAPATVAVLRTADLKAVTATTGAPGTANTGVPFNVTVDGSVHNNGPDSAPADISVTLNLPPDCATPTNPQTLSLNLPVSVSTPIPTQIFPVTCTDKSFHNFDATVDVNAPLHVIDATPGNDTVASTSVTTAVFAPSDVKIASVTVNAPANADVGVPFTVSATANVHNNGAFGPTNTDASVLLSLPGDCSTGDPNPVDTADLALPVSAATPLNASWSVTCTTHSFHSFSASATIAVDDLHVTDPNGGNNSGGSAPDQAAVFTYADGKIASATILSPPTFIAANTNVNVTVRKMLHNNGPFGPATFNLTKSSPAVPGCVITPPAASGHPLAVSVATQVDEVWTVNCAPGTYNITFNNLLSVTGLHVADPNAGNNTSSVMLIVIADTDGDGIPDDVENGCGSNPNSGLSIPERIDGAFAGVDDDGDTQVDEALPVGATAFDCDRDGFRGTPENHVYFPSTQGDQDPCGSGVLPPVVPPLPIGWPADLIGGAFSGNKLNVQDLATYIGPTRLINTNVGTNFGDRRWDVVPGTGGPLPFQINVIDMATILVLKPPMLGNTTAFAGPDCPFAP